MVSVEWRSSPKIFRALVVHTQLSVDVTLVSALCSSGEPQPHTAEVDGVVLERARHVKEATCRIGAMPTGRPRHRDGPSMERGSSAHGSTACHRPRTGCPTVHVTPSLAGLGATLDTHVGHYMRSRLRSLLGGAIQVVRVLHRRHGTRTRGSAGAGSAVVSLAPLKTILSFHLSKKKTFSQPKTTPNRIVGFRVLLPHTPIQGACEGHSSLPFATVVLS